MLNESGIFCLKAEQIRPLTRIFLCNLLIEFHEDLGQNKLEMCRCAVATQSSPTRKVNRSHLGFGTKLFTVVEFLPQETQIMVQVFIFFNQMLTTKSFAAKLPCCCGGGGLIHGGG